MKWSSLSLVIVFALKSSTIMVYSLLILLLLTYFCPIFKIYLLQAAWCWVLFFYLIWQLFQPLKRRLYHQSSLPWAKHPFIIVWLILFLDSSLLLSNSFVHVCLKGTLNHEGALSWPLQEMLSSCTLRWLALSTKIRMYLVPHHWVKTSLDHLFHFSYPNHIFILANYWLFDLQVNFKRT